MKKNLISLLIILFPIIRLSAQHDIAGMRTGFNSLHLIGYTPDSNVTIRRSLRPSIEAYYRRINDERHRFWEFGLTYTERGFKMNPFIFDGQKLRIDQKWVFGNVLIGWKKELPDPLFHISLLIGGGAGYLVGEKTHFHTYDGSKIKGKGLIYPSPMLGNIDLLLQVSLDYQFAQYFELEGNLRGGYIMYPVLEAAQPGAGSYLEFLAGVHYLIHIQ